MVQSWGEGCYVIELRFKIIRTERCAKMVISIIKGIKIKSHRLKVFGLFVWFLVLSSVVQNGDILT